MKGLSFLFLANDKPGPFFFFLQGLMALLIDLHAEENSFKDRQI